NRTTEKHHMFRYDIAGDSFSEVTGMPLWGLHGGRLKKKKAKDGSSGAYYDGMIYALKGGNTQQFFGYDVAADTWTELDTVPTFGSTGRRKRVKHGADIVAYGGGAFFALKGNKTNEMWRYVAPAGMALVSRPERSGAMGGRAELPLGVTCAPNPVARGQATVRYSLPQAGAARVSVFDVTGRSVLSRSLVATRTGAVRLDLRSLGAGIYLVKLESGDQSWTSKLVVQH
ncbi:T9SS type A sorting domain-containing protein, partial [candidate division WOR-3 bacterium]|nr:T9SS type A sorting domain-containing protein [candidate division WOR-3 bacterium]